VHACPTTARVRVWVGAVPMVARTPRTVHQPVAQMLAVADRWGELSQRWADGEVLGPQLVVGEGGARGVSAGRCSGA
jgi:hypothetical protein